MTYRFLTQGGAADEFLRRPVLRAGSYGYDTLAGVSDYNRALHRVSARWVQCALNLAGPLVTEDGYAGPGTMNALRMFGPTTYGRTTYLRTTPSYIEIEHALERSLALVPAAGIARTAPIPPPTEIPPPAAVPPPAPAPGQRRVDLTPVVRPVVRRLGLALVVGAGLAVGVGAAVLMSIVSQRDPNDLYD